MHSTSLFKALLGVVLLLAWGGAASARTWTNHEGRQIEADYVRLDGLNVVLLMNGREVSVPLANLSQGDKQYVFQQLAGGAKAASASETDASDDSEPSGTSPAEAKSDTRRSDNPSNGVARVRTWKDSDGNTSRAKFIRIHEGNVVLMQGSKTVMCPIAKLSAEDQDYLRTLLEARGEGHLMPSAAELAAAERGPSGAAGYGGAAGPAGVSPSFAGGAPAGPSYTPSFSPNSSTAMAGGPAMAPVPTPGAYTAPTFDSSAAGAAGYAAHAEASTPGALPAYAGSSSAPYGSASPASNPAYNPPGYNPAMPGGSADSFTASPSGYPGGSEVASAAPLGYSSGMSPPDPAGGMTPPDLSGGMTSPGASFMPAANLDAPLGQQLEYYCSNCKKSVPEHINDRCPHCGVRFDYVEQADGSRKYNGRYLGGGIGGIIAVVVGVIIRLFVMAQRRG